MSSRLGRPARLDLPEWVRRDLVLASSLAPLAPDDRARNLAARHEGAGITRGCVVLDAGLEHLADELTDRNFIPITARADCRGDRALLCGRVLLTARPADFVEDASSFDVGIVSVAALPPKAIADAVRVVAVFSRATAHLALFRRSHGFILVLRIRGEHHWADLVD